MTTIYSGGKEILYKLTTPKGMSEHNNLIQWGENITHSLPVVKNPGLRANQVIHAYRSPHLALLLNSVHANYDNPTVWQSEGDVVVEDWGRVGCFNLTTLKKMELAVTPRIYCRFAILCAGATLSMFEKKEPFLKDARLWTTITISRMVLAETEKAWTALAVEEGWAIAATVERAVLSAWEAAMMAEATGNKKFSLTQLAEQAWKEVCDAVSS